MAKQLKRIFTPSVDQVDQTYTINAWHVSQSVDALTGIDDYDITISGSFTVTGSIFHAEIQDASGVASSVLVRDNNTGEYYYTGSYSTGGGGGSTDTGSLLLTASISNNTITFTKGDGTTFNVTVDTGSDTNIGNTDLTLDSSRILNFDGNNLTFSSSIGEAFIIESSQNSAVDIRNLTSGSRPNIIFHDSESGQIFTYPTNSLPFLSDSDTGSFYYSSSVSLNTITFYQGDGTTETVIVNTGSGGGGSTDYVSNVVYNTGSIAFTGVGSAFNSSINISDLTGSLVTTSSFNAATGSFLTTGSVSNNTITLTKGDGSTFDLTVNTGSGGGGSTDYVSDVTYETGSIDFSGVGNAFTGSLDISELTGSSLVTSSVSNNEITFTKGDGTSYTITVDTGSGGGGGSALTASNEGTPIDNDVTDINFTGEIVNVTQTVAGEVQVDFTPPGNTTEIIYNSASEFHATGSLTFDDSGQQTLTVDGALVTQSSAIVSTGSVYSFVQAGLGLFGDSVNDGYTYIGYRNSGANRVYFDNTSIYPKIGYGAVNIGGNVNHLFNHGAGDTNQWVLAVNSADAISTNGTFKISASGQIFAEDIYNINQQHVVVYNTASGEITYYTASAFGGGGGSTDYISNVVYNTGSIAFTGVGSAFNSSINISDLTGSLVTTSSFNTATGSFYYSSSVSLNTITFYQGDGTSETVTVDTGSGGGGGGNTFATMSVGGQNIIADSSTDTLTIANGTLISSSANTSTDTYTINVLPSTQFVTKKQGEGGVGGGQNFAANVSASLTWTNTGPDHTNNSNAYWDINNSGGTIVYDTVNYKTIQLAEAGMYEIEYQFLVGGNTTASYASLILERVDNTEIHQEVVQSKVIEGSFTGDGESVKYSKVYYYMDQTNIEGNTNYLMFSVTGSVGTTTVGGYSSADQNATFWSVKKIHDAGKIR